MKTRGSYGSRFTAGGVFGLYMAHLLYFLNPQIRIAPVRLFGITLVYAAVAGLVFGTILFLVRRFRQRVAPQPAAPRGSGVGFLASAGLIAAFVYWGHLLLLRVYLPRGAVRVLSKASTIVGVAGVLILLLWILDRWTRRRRSPVLFASACGIVIASAVLLHVRHELYRSEPEPAAPVRSPEPKSQRPVVLVVVPDLPFDWLLQLTAEDQLPFFARARGESFLTRVEPFPTTSPKTLWASLATGKLPHGHGVTGRFSYRTPLTRLDERYLLVPYWVGFKAWGLIPPVQRISAQLPAGDATAVWTIFQRTGNPAAVINWPASGLPALPDDVATAQAERHLQNEPKPALTIVSINGMIEAQQALPLNNQLPPRGSREGEAVRERTARIDEQLGRIDRAARDATLIVISQSGVEPPVLPATPLEIAKAWFSDQEPGGSDGFLLVRGPYIESRPNPAAVSVTDLVPTILFAAGLPVGRDMDGRAVAEAFTPQFVRENSIAMVATYETPARPKGNLAP